MATYHMPSIAITYFDVQVLTLLLFNRTFDQMDEVSTSLSFLKNQIHILPIHSLAEVSMQYNVLFSVFFGTIEREQAIVVPARCHSHYPSVTRSAGSSQTPSGSPGAGRSQRG